MDTEQLKTLAPHYLVMFALGMAALWGLSAALGRLDVWIQLVVILVVVLGYRTAATALGFAPEPWRR